MVQGRAAVESHKALSQSTAKEFCARALAHSNATEYYDSSHNSDLDFSHNHTDSVHFWG